METLVIDRFEGGFAVCESSSGEMITIPKTKLPENAKEGSVLKETFKGFAIDLDEEQRRKERIKKLEDSLFD